ncbi:MAG: type II toxin-antitoxin system VapB family antitoxin [Bacteroidetes bacterium]|nr:type II toxin-antitoxin system VapB family antitoxin [Bacteroidota bacterium]MBI3481582.1 type II toxin-antitoxin system VapB family antitoxin [Bacteroidota bacterium]
MEKMVKINVDINDEVMEKAIRLSGIKTKKELVNKALRFYRDLLTNEKKESNQKA